MSEDINELYNNVEYLFRDGQYAEALYKINESLDYLWQVKFSPQVILRLTALKLSVLVKLKEYDKAVELADDLLDQCSDLDLKHIIIDTLLDKAEIYIDLRDKNETEKVLEEATRLIEDTRGIDKELYIENVAKLNIVVGKHKISLNQFFRSIDNFEESLKKYRQISNLYGISTSLYYLGRALYLSGEFETAENFWDQSFEMFQDLGYKRPLVDYYIGKAGIFFNKGLLSQALETIGKATILCEELGDDLSLAKIYHRTGYIYKASSNYDKSLEYILKSKTFFEKMDLEHEVAKTYLDIAGIYRNTGNYNLALNHLNQHLQIKRKLDDELGVTIALCSMGRIHLILGNLEVAEKCYINALEIAMNHGRQETLSNVYFSLGDFYYLLGDLEKSSKNYLQSLQIREKINKVFLIASSLKSLISINLDLKLNKLAEGFLQNLKKLSETTENLSINQMYRLAEAIYTKTTGSVRERQKASVILEHIAQEEVIDYMIKIEALLHLSEWLLWEISQTENEEILEEINVHLEALEKIARSQNMYPLLAESLLLQAELSLIELKVEKAREIFAEGLRLAESKGLRKLAIKISNEYDQLLDQLGLWEEFTLRLPSIAEKLELSHIEERLNEVVKKRSALSRGVEAEEEQPVMFMIFSTESSILFSEYFEEFDGHQISTKILQTLKDYTIELKENKEERIRLEDYTILFQSFKSIVLCYVYIGKSYLATQKLAEFCKLLSKSKKTLDKLLIAEKNNTSLQYEERVEISKFIDEIFS